MLGGERPHPVITDALASALRDATLPRTLPAAFDANDSVDRVSTAHRPPGRGRTSVTVVSGWTTAPAPSASPR